MAAIQTSDAIVSFTDIGVGTPIVLLHGIQGTARTWDAVAPLLWNRHRVILPNLRGRAESSTPDEPEAYRLSAFASDLLSVLDFIGQPTLLVAWSMGVSVTLELLRQHPQVHLSGLVLVSGSACVGTEARWFSGKSAAEVAQEARARADRLSLVEAAKAHAVAASWMQVQQADFRSLLPTIKSPSLIIHGVDDDQCPLNHGRIMAQSIPGAWLEEWTDTGHNPMAKNPARLAEAILQFADSIGHSGPRQ